MPILIVDDFSTMRRIVKNCLKQLGFSNLHEAADGQLAWEKIQEQEFAFIVSDWNMPNKMGIDLLRDVRGDARFKEIPFLMVTAEAQKENILEAAKAGVSNYIIKPFTADLLSEKMEAIFKNRVQ
ncbi:MAG: response regulator [Bdellovibrionales bacterium]|nr:response regulator [Bdellovibrionales bacterium]